MGKQEFEVMDAVRVNFEMPAKLENYMNVWLILTNTVKDRSNEFLKLKNDYDNGAYVVLDTDEVEVLQVIEWLERLGCSQFSETKVKTVSALFDYNDYDVEYEMLEIREY